MHSDPADAEFHTLLEEDFVIESLKLGFLGLGAIGFPMCYGLSKSYPMNLPTYRRERDQRAGFSPVAKDSAEKAVRIDEMLANGATACT